MVEYCTRSVDSRARGIRVCHLSWTNQRTFFWTIKRKPTFWTTSLLTRTHPLLLKPFFLGRHLYKKRLTLIEYRQRKFLRLWDLCRISPRAGVTKSLIVWWRRLAVTTPVSRRPTLQGTTLLNLQYRDGSRLRDQNEDTKQKAQYLYTATQHLTQQWQHRDRNARDNSMNTTPADLQITAESEVLQRRNTTANFRSWTPQ